MNILITRAAEQCWETVNLLSEAGATPYCLPMIETVPLDARFEKDSYDYLLFTSPSAVRWFSSYACEVKAGAYIAVGPATAEKIAERFQIPQETVIIPEVYSADGLQIALDGFNLEGKSILAPGPRIRAKDLSPFFKEKNAYFEPVALYETAAVTHKINVNDFFAKYRINVVCFFSPSAVDAFFMQASLPVGMETAAIGHTTARALEVHGVTDFILPAEHTAAGLVNLIKQRRQEL